MAANVESMMYFGQRPWHGLGTELDKPATAEDAIICAGLDWEVQKYPMHLEVGPGEPMVQIPDAYATVRVRPGGKINRQDILGVVGERYLPLQNKDAFAFFDAIVGERQAIYHTAGVLGKGERIWLLAKLPGEIVVPGNDITEKFLLLTNSHNGNSSVQVKFTPIRVVCQNTLSAAMSDGGDIVNIRHTSYMDGRLKEAHKLLNITNTYYQRLDEVFKAMARKPLDVAGFDTYLSAVLPEASDETRGNVTSVFEMGAGSDIQAIRGTLWAGYNAFTEYSDWHRPRVKSEKRLNSIWFGSGAQIKQRAFVEAEKILMAA